MHLFKNQKTTEIRLSNENNTERMRVYIKAPLFVCAMDCNRTQDNNIYLVWFSCVCVFA